MTVVSIKRDVGSGAWHRREEGARGGQPLAPIAGPHAGRAALNASQG